MANPWDFEWRVELLRKLWAEGQSANQIAYRIGVTRNAVIGKVHRLGLVLTAKQRSIRQAVNGISAGRKRSQKIKAARLYDPPKAVIFTVEALPAPRVEDLARKAMADLADNECRYPVGDPQAAGFGFCALEQMPNSVYCPVHHAACWIPVPKRTNRPFDVSVPVKQREDA